jgi:polysaccharide export outer membrane protein
MTRISINFILLYCAVACVLLSHSARAATDTATDGHLSNYKLQPMDLIKIQVFQEPDLDRELRVPKDSVMEFPLVGRVEVKNLTVREIEVKLTDLYRKDYLVNPQINITILDYAQRTINVLGAVNNPGSVVIPPEKELTLIEGVARAGGFSRLANRSRISLTRTLSDGRVENYVVNADQIMAGDVAHRWPLLNGDVIYVPEKIL